MPVLFSPVYSPYLPVSIAVFFHYLEFTWRGAPPPLSSGACHILAAVTSFPLSKVAGQIPLFLPSLTGFIYSLSGE
jgi:hypothetical protein